MSTYPKIFLSHSHKDRQFATELQKILEDQGGETYLDQDKIQAGDILPGRINDGISWCDTLLLIWSGSAAMSDWVGKEWNMAYDLRKKIIPYSLDRTPLPDELQDRVRVESDDLEHGNANLLIAVFGPNIKVGPTPTPFPGNWQATVDAMGVVQGNYDIILRANGQVEGSGGINNSGIAGQLAGQMGMSGLLNMRIPFQGTWSYNQGSKTLTIETSTAVVFGQQQNDTIRIHATGHERGAIIGHDLAGRTWTLRRVGKAERSGIDDEKQKIRDGFQQIYDSAKGSPVLAVLMASYCVGAQERIKRDIGLPIKKARRIMQTDGDAFQEAVKDFFGALERGGWII